MQEQDVLEKLEQISQYLNFWQIYIECNDVANAIEKLEKQSLDQNLWNDQDNAKKVLQELSKLKNMYTEFNKSTKDLKDLKEAVKTDYDDFAEMISEETLDLYSRVESWYVQTLFSDESDALDCYLDLNAGAGGTESQDWVEMLLRMYIRFAEKNGYKCEITDQLMGEGAGVKSATIKISSGESSFPYGWLKGESGVHRLVRVSPFDSNNRRHTSFASVYTTPAINDDIKVEIDAKDIRIDTYRASGAGGQHVNKTDSAIRITHIPTGIVVQCQNDRSQHKNKDQAMGMLKSRIYSAELEKKKQEAAEGVAAKRDNAWGSQIRSYVLHPYKMIKDVRTGTESTQADKVLDGDIKEFLISFLKQQRYKKKS
ncbi:peptide chain release factor 2 [Candidatus Cytomitobacter indipagum]|uniref:Peptide chain release factor 2 n=1 Tax=Candidatus Cytomitobacter indipagum TaxID=2601575 RepID=A0A5C0UES6_9PROT|nr:peptide chain release factor 2 [Candidatus Cytomitobacter indipagum]QEK38191.1 peptide chain release factor 2 [Candidatus Cytomitobacter indipagum]